MTTFCPSCLEPTDVRANAREGRCDECRPQRVHSPKQKDKASPFQQYTHWHNQQASQ